MQRRIKAAIGSTAAVASLALIVTGRTTGGSVTPPTDGGTAPATLTLLDTATGECAAPPAEGVKFDEAKAYVEQFQQKSQGIIPELLGWDPLPAAPTSRSATPTTCRPSVTACGVRLSRKPPRQLAACSLTTRRATQRPASTRSSLTRRTF